MPMLPHTPHPTHVYICYDMYRYTETDGTCEANGLDTVSSFVGLQMSQLVK